MSIIYVVISIKTLLSGISGIEMKAYFEKYGSEQYGKTAYYIDKIKKSSMFVWIIGLWIAKYFKHKNIKLSKLIKILSIAILLITQLMPLAYVIYARNSRVDETNYESYTSEYCYKENCTNKRENDDIYCYLHQPIPIRED